MSDKSKSNKNSVLDEIPVEEQKQAEEITRERVTTPEETFVKPEQTEKKPKEDYVKPQKSKRLVSLKEFLIGTEYRREYIAGFKMYLKTHYQGAEFMTSENWKEVLGEYSKR